MRNSSICQLNVLENLIGAKPTELIWTIDFYRLLLIPEMTFHDYMPDNLCTSASIAAYLVIEFEDEYALRKLQKMVFVCIINL